MSDSDSKIHWRLNDLLRAGKKAKEFGANILVSGSTVFKEHDGNLKKKLN